MKNAALNKSRREFLTRAVPACALSMCAMSCLSSVSAFSGELAIHQDEHKFDKEVKLPKPLTMREFSRVRNANFIRLCSFLTDELGEENALELISEYSEKRAGDIGKWRASNDGDNSFTNCMSLFKSPQMLETLNMEIVEDTDTVFEVKITECLSYETYRQMKCDGKLGYACVCHGDYGYVEGYNPMIKLIRDKTLMEGDEYCNHRYELQS